MLEAVYTIDRNLSVLGDKSKRTYSKKEKKNSLTQKLFLSPILGVIDPDSNLEKVKKLKVLYEMGLLPEQAISNLTLYSLTQPKGQIENLTPYAIKGLNYQIAIAFIREKFRSIYKLLQRDLDSKKIFEQEMSRLTKGLDYKRLANDLEKYTERVGELLNNDANKLFKQKIKTLDDEIKEHLTYLKETEEMIESKFKKIKEYKGINEYLSKNSLENLRLDALINASFAIYDLKSFNIERIVEKSIKEEIKSENNSKKKKAALIGLLGLMGGAELLKTHDKVSSAGALIELSVSGQFIDEDGDGLPDSLEMMIFNRHKGMITDTNGDSRINYFDVVPSMDYDGDGTILDDEFMGIDYGNDPDWDGDGIPNIIEEYMGTDPYNFGDGFEDSDEDGIPNLLEWRFALNPAAYDTDHNGVSDGEEDVDDDGLPFWYELQVLNTDPMNPDSDGNGVSDGEEDYDSDGFSNLTEYKDGTDPYDPEDNAMARLIDDAILPFTFLIGLPIGCYFIGKRRGGGPKDERAKRKAKKKEYEEHGPKVGETSIRKIPQYKHDVKDFDKYAQKYIKKRRT